MKASKNRKTSLPQKNYKVRIRFDEDPNNRIPCALRMTLNGIDVENATDQQKKEFSLSHCDHPVFPPIFPQCGACIKENCGIKYLVDSKGNQYRTTK